MSTPRYLPKLPCVLTLFGLSLLSSLGGFAQTEFFEQAAAKTRQDVDAQYWNPAGNYYRGDNKGETFVNYWWNANALESMTEAYVATRSPELRQRMKRLLYAIRDNDGGTFTTQFYDDMEWLAIACIKAYEVTDDREYLDVANELWRDILTGRSPEYQGAISWNKDCHPSCKNAISNTPAAVIAAQLYRITGNQAELDYAREIHAYVKDKLVDPATGGVWDGYNPVTGEVNDRNDWIFTYNLGMYMAAGFEIFKVTGDRGYLDDAVRTADYALDRFGDGGGLLFTTGGGQGDGGLFNGIFIRCLAQMVREFDLPGTRNRDWSALIKRNARVLVEQGTRADGLVGVNWNRRPGSDDKLDVTTQLSGLMLLDAAASMDKVTVAQNLNYGGNTVRLAAGDYDYNALIAAGALNDDLSSIAIPEGFTVELYTDDGFRGERLDLTESRGWIGGEFNDLVSSLKIRGGNVDDGTDPDPAFSRRIQAEDFTFSNGIITEGTTDEGGGENVGAIQAGSWMSYAGITVPRSGTYTVRYRVSGLWAGELGLDLDGGSVVLGTLPTPNTGGWQNWTTIAQTVTLEAGTYSFGVFARSSGWNINWFEIVEGDAGLGARTDLDDVQQVALFPNPVSDALTVTGLAAGSTVSVVDAVGKIVLRDIRVQSTGATELDVARLAAGVYHLRVGGAAPGVHKFVKR